MIADHFAKNLPIVGGPLQVASVDAEHRAAASRDPRNRIAGTAVVNARPRGRWRAVYEAVAFDGAARDERNARLRVVRAHVRILHRRPAELAQSDDHHIVPTDLGSGARIGAVLAINLE